MSICPSTINSYLTWCNITLYFILHNSHEVVGETSVKSPSNRELTKENPISYPHGQAVGPLRPGKKCKNEKKKKKIKACCCGQMFQHHVSYLDKISVIYWNTEKLCFYDGNQFTQGFMPRSSCRHGDTSMQLLLIACCFSAKALPKSLLTYHQSGDPPS